MREKREIQNFDGDGENAFEIFQAFCKGEFQKHTSKKEKIEEWTAKITTFLKEPFLEMFSKFPGNVQKKW